MCFSVTMVVVKGDIMNYGAWFTLFIMAFISIAVLLMFIGYPSEDEINKVMNAIEKTYPESTFYNIHMHITVEGSLLGEKEWPIAKVYSILEILEMEEVVASFERDIGVDEKGNRKPYICWMIIGRWNKNKGKRLGGYTNLLGEAI